MSNAFMVYLPKLPHGKIDIERGELPWVYDQSPSSGFVATMRVVPKDDYKKLEAENKQLREALKALRGIEASQGTVELNSGDMLAFCGSPAMSFPKG